MTTSSGTQTQVRVIADLSPFRPEREERLFTGPLALFRAWCFAKHHVWTHPHGEAVFYRREVQLDDPPPDPHPYAEAALDAISILLSPAGVCCILLGVEASFFAWLLYRVAEAVVR